MLGRTAAVVGAKRELEFAQQPRPFAASTGNALHSAPFGAAAHQLQPDDRSGWNGPAANAIDATAGAAAQWGNASHPRSFVGMRSDFQHSHMSAGGSGSGSGSSNGRKMNPHELYSHGATRR